ncbi:MAG: MarC family protein [Parachlamydiales bacterium]|jgi:multiple antibiotic resistance protein
MQPDLNFWETVISIFFVFNAMGMIPAFVALLSKFDQKRQIKIIIRECLIALFVLLAFTFFGARILKSFSLSQSTIGVGGGLLLIIIALNMIFPKESHSHEKSLSASKDPLIIPLAIPGLAGPGTIAALAVLSNQVGTLVASGALIVAWIPSLFILLACSYLKKILGEKGLLAVEKLGGMLICFIGIETLTKGVVQIVINNFFTK